MAVAPRTKDKNHIFKNTTEFGLNDSIEWMDGPYAVLEHAVNNVKLFLDVSSNIELKKWRFSQIKFDRIDISNSRIVIDDDTPVSFGNYFNSNANIRARLGFKNVGRLLTYKSTLGERKTITKWDGSERSDLIEDYKGRFSNYTFNSGCVQIDVHKFSEWGTATCKSLSFTSNSKRTGLRSEMIDLEVKLIDSNDEGIEGAPIFFHINSGPDHSIYHTDIDHSKTDAQGIARCTLELKEEGICEIVAKVECPSEFVSEPFEILTIDEETEIYVRGVTFQTKYFVNDYKAFYSYLESMFQSVPNLTWGEMAFTQANITDASNNSYEQLVVFLKRIRFNGRAYLSEAEAGDLRTAIINKLNANADILFQDVELRTYRKFVNI